MHCADFLTQFYAYNDINNLQKLILIQQHQQNMPRWQMTVKYILKSKQCQQSTTTHRQAMKREVLDDCNEYKNKIPHKNRQYHTEYRRGSFACMYRIR